MVTADPNLAEFQLRYNACICGLGELAAFLRVSAKKMTVHPSPTTYT